MVVCGVIRSLSFNRLGVATAVGLAVINCSVSWQLTAAFLAKSVAVVNAICLRGLFLQRRGYAKILGTRYDDRLYAASFLACFLLFFGVAETACAAFLSWSVARIADPVKPFTALQMYSQLRETTALFALGSFVSVLSHLPLIVLQQFFLLRLMAGGGLAKRCGNWASGEAMQTHFWTAPLPTVFAPFFHSLPKWVHSTSSKAALWVEGWPTALVQLLPFQAARNFVALLYAAVLLMINTTGSYGFLGILSVMQVCSLLSDAYMWSGLKNFTFWMRWMPGSFHHPLLTLLSLVFVAPYLGASLVPFHECCRCAIPDWMQGAFDDAMLACALLERYFVLGKYAQFVGVTKTRMEVILQVADAGGEFIDWPFRYKPTPLDRRLPITVLRMPGVDWQMWFLGLRPYERPQWVNTFMQYLVNQDEDVCSLMGLCPVKRPAVIRAAVFDYRFSGDPAVDSSFERGRIWSRKFIKFLGPPITRQVDGMYNLEERGSTCR